MRFDVPTLEEYRFFRLYSMDLNDARVTLELTQRVSDDSIRIPILRDAIVTYARPFSKNFGRLHSKHRLTEEFVQKESLALHRELLEFRDSAFAHTDHEFRNPSVSRWHDNDGRPFYAIQFRVIPWIGLLRRMPEIHALFSAVERSIGGWIARFERDYKAFDH